jgi:IS30 family transposase
MTSKKPCKQISLAKAREYVQAWSSSGLSQTAYSLKLGFSKSAMYRWLRRIRVADARSNHEKVSDESESLHSVEVIGQPSSPSTTLPKQQVEICLPDNTRLRFPSIISPQQIAKLIKELQSCN